MITAEEARKLSFESVNAQLKEYLDNSVTPAIQKAAQRGDFRTTVGLKEIKNYAIIGKEAIKVLTMAGFNAKHVYNSDQRDYENHLEIRWDKETI